MQSQRILPTIMKYFNNFNILHNILNTNFSFNLQIYITLQIIYKIYIKNENLRFQFILFKNRYLYQLNKSFLSQSSFQIYSYFSMFIYHKIRIFQCFFVIYNHYSFIFVLFQNIFIYFFIQNTFIINYRTFTGMYFDILFLFYIKSQSKVSCLTSCSIYFLCQKERSQIKFKFLLISKSFDIIFKLFNDFFFEKCQIYYRFFLLIVQNFKDFFFYTFQFIIIPKYLFNICKNTIFFTNFLKYQLFIIFQIILKISIQQLHNLMQSRLKICVL
ncbi:hypothetical protein IMG5_124220 [Ichthyophthirius multifiliis]|uniref:Transmembrane protein n=1 Tax=Ichthyophthirius multifiliis TaxID=5932 RepID=G0QVJ6_ICHMU|nr:hypothetical protein IMG5_124220 [Ichthyophthirius multifiliis]EGR30756.1 hypothetical protein IMG5_124220 [Ichthyophthirius multifiliis]|eukprot:XP_004032343.1 hypothetical protein IMG5_124220 [Ichthyophthirius multifiliis]